MNLKKESLTVVCGNQPILAFVLLSSLALAGATLFSDLFSIPFSPAVKYGMTALAGVGGVLGQRQRYKRLAGITDSKQQPTKL